MESVIPPIIMSLKEPLVAINTRTKIIPMATREAVRKVLLLYRLRFLMAILNKLPIFIPSLVLPADHSSVFQLVDHLSLSDDLLIVR